MRGRTPCRVGLAIKMSNTTQSKMAENFARALTSKYSLGSRGRPAKVSKALFEKVMQESLDLDHLDI